MKYRHIKNGLSPVDIVAYLGRADIPIIDVGVTQGYTDEGEPFVEVDFGNIQLSANEQRKLAIYLGDVTSALDDLKGRIEKIEKDKRGLAR